MAGIGVEPGATVISLRAQYGAVAAMRWRMLLNSLRTRRGSFEMGARIFTQGFFALIGLGIGIGLGFAAWVVETHNSPAHLAVLFWPVLVFWQVIPITIASFQENADLSIFLRFPVNFISYTLFYILFGLFDIGSLVGGIALFGIWIGASIARPDLIGWITLAVALFAIFNIFLTRMIFAWLDRWLAQRKTREVLGMIFLFLLLGAQFLNPAFYHGGFAGPTHHAAIARYLHTAERVQVFLPPGLAATAIDSAHQEKPLQAGANLFFLALYAAGAGALLGVRLRAEYRGESLGEAPPRTAKITRARSSAGRFEGSSPVAAVVGKEIRYLMRSGVMLYGFLAPLIIVFLFSNGAPGGHGVGFAREYALPVGVAYSFLGLTRFIYNNLGGEGAGIQIYFLSPTPFRDVMLAKNIVHFLIFLVELALVWAIVAFRTGMPGPQMLAITLCWLVFALPAQLAMGNILSLTMAYRMNMARMSREQGATGNSLLSMLVQLIVFAVGAAVYLPLKATGHANLAAPALLVLAAGSIIFWLRTLANSGAMVAARKETLVATLYKTA
jgi:ABC-2 type transport system permease protein